MPLVRPPKAFRATQPAVAALLFAGLTIGVGGAATIHRLAATQGTGSEGAVTYNNTSPTGAAIEGTVSTGPDTNVKLPFGVLGEYLASSSQFGIGIGGVSTSGYGVGAEALGPNPALYAVSSGTAGAAQFVLSGSKSAGAGVSIDTTAAGTGASIYTDPGLSITTGSYSTGAVIKSVNGPAVSASTSVADGVDAYTAANSANGLASAVVGNSQHGGSGMLGLDSGEGVVAMGASGNKAHPALAAVSEMTGTDLFGTFAPPKNSAFTTVETFVVSAGTANRSGGAAATSTNPAPSDVQVSGDLYVYGHIFQDCNAFPAVSTTPCYDVPLSGADGTSLRTRTIASNTVEIDGQARLANGSAYVALDRTFADSISPNSPYLVFITPTGSSHGLYTEQHTGRGFVVRENEGGRASLSFDYRIVARPAADGSPTARETKVAGHGLPITDPSIAAEMKQLKAMMTRLERRTAALPVRHLTRATQ